MAIVTNKFRVNAASSFAQTFTTDSMYMVIGRPQSWSDTSYSTTFGNQTNGTPGDNNPPSPYDNQVNETAFWRDAMAGVRIFNNDIRLATVRYNWLPTTRYDMYQHNINASNPTVNGAFNLADSNMIVYVTSTGNVYKCIFNGKSALQPTARFSTVEPSTTGTDPQTTADGYVWKYLYNIPASEVDFVTSTYIPVPTTQSIATSNGIHVILVDAAGSGYTTAGTTIAVYGDGVGCAAIPTISGSSISTITVTNPGTGYTWAKVVITGPGSAASSTAIIAPSGGHASNLRQECSAFNVMLAGTISGYQNNDVPVNQDFRSVALIKNPFTYTATTITSTGTIATGSTGRISRGLNVTSTASVTPDIMLLGGSSAAIGIAVFQSSGTTQLWYNQPVPADVPNNILLSTLNVATKNLNQFQNGENISGVGYSDTINSSNGITAYPPELQPYSGEVLYLDYRQPVTRQAGQNEKINIVINF
jgi:hypothetical protein